MRKENKDKILEQFRITEEDVIDFRERSVGLNGISLAQVSWFLSAQLACAQKFRTLSTFAVTDVIQWLEGRNHRQTATKVPEQFKHQPLKGLWKAHFVDARYIYRNIINHWGLQYEMSPKFSKLCNEVAKEEESDPSPHGWQGRLAQRFVDGYLEKAQKKSLTGEWLIFAKDNGKNYYLCITSHTANKEADNALFTALLALCSEEFPFLKKETENVSADEASLT